MLETLKLLVDMQAPAAFFGAVTALCIGGVIVAPVIAYTRRQSQRLELERKQAESNASIEIARINVSTKNGLVVQNRDQ